ncbi:helix-turn-helix transcriptional regulator [Streptomyces sp. YS-3]|uniref:helix-turn-helix transcriptional regulator n=1 Tax=Streptomyces sp. YS-3 TaxID=3381352 RepID=UPI003862C18F
MTDTPARLLQLLSLLQTPREWPGGELAERLAVSRRTVRRDVDRLRELGYPVQATLGADGGYRLVAGKAMPPLVLDDEEAVAIAVGLRHRVATLQAATMPLTGPWRGDGASVDPHTLTVMASAVTGRERLRFDYRKGDGSESRRQVEPYRLVSTGRRWYLVAYDIEREDWRTFRVDRVAAPFATGSRFAPRELPAQDAAEFVSRSLTRMQPELDLDVTFEAPADFVTARLTPSMGAPVPLGGARCRLRARVTESLEWVAIRLALVDCEFAVASPGALTEYLADLGSRLTRAAGPQPE